MLCQIGKFVIISSPFARSSGMHPSTLCDGSEVAAWEPRITSRGRSFLLRLWSSFCWRAAWKEAALVHVLAALPPTRDTEMEFLASGSGLHQPQLLWELREWSEGWKPWIWLSDFWIKWKWNKYLNQSIIYPKAHLLLSGFLVKGGKFPLLALHPQLSSTWPNLPYCHAPSEQGLTGLHAQGPAGTSSTSPIWNLHFLWLLKHKPCLLFVSFVCLNYIT